MKRLAEIEEEGRKRAVIAHEIGHALKLSHNMDGPSYKDTFPALMQNKIEWFSGDQWYDASAGYCSWEITNFDKSALRSKWGK